MTDTVTIKQETAPSEMDILKLIPDIADELYVKDGDGKREFIKFLDREARSIESDLPFIHKRAILWVSALDYRESKKDCDYSIKSTDPLLTDKNGKEIYLWDLGYYSQEYTLYLERQQRSTTIGEWHDQHKIGISRMIDRMYSLGFFGKNASPLVPKILKLFYCELIRPQDKIADRLDITQPIVSNAINRFERILADPSPRFKAHFKKTPVTLDNPFAETTRLPIRFEYRYILRLPICKFEKWIDEIIGPKTAIFHPQPYPPPISPSGHPMKRRYYKVYGPTIAKTTAQLIERHLHRPRLVEQNTLESQFCVVCH